MIQKSALNVGWKQLLHNSILKWTWPYIHISLLIVFQYMYFFFYLADIGFILAHSLYLVRWKIQKLLQYFLIYLCIRSMKVTNHDTFLFHKWDYIFRIAIFSNMFLILSYNKKWSRYWNSTIDHHEKENIAKIGHITRALKPPNLPLTFYIISPP